jgi:hypothetical protein
VNPGQEIALLGLGQLLIAVYFDRKFADVEAPMFEAEVESYPALEMKAWFTDAKQGKTRSREVLRIARLPTAARQSLVALLVSAVAAAVTFFIVLEAHEHPSFRTLRLAANGVAGVACLCLAIGLLLRIAQRNLSATAKTHSEYRADNQPKNWLARWFARVRSLETLTPYLSVAFLGAAVAIVTAVGL